MPTHSLEQWSTATNTAAWPSPVTTVVRSIPHIASTRSVTIVPSGVGSKRLAHQRLEVAGPADFLALERRAGSRALAPSGSLSISR
jgi:hypothetical protein